MRGGKKSSKYQVGQIIMVAYPYQEQPEITKNRPGLIISIEQNELVVLPITSQEKYRGDLCYIEEYYAKPPSSTSAATNDLMLMALKEPQQIPKGVRFTSNKT